VLLTYGTIFQMMWCLLPSLNSFKGRIDNYWNDYQFSVDFDTFKYRPPVISQKVFQGLIFMAAADDDDN